jgi:hypothetical protein
VRWGSRGGSGRRVQITAKDAMVWGSMVSVKASAPGCGPPVGESMLSSRFESLLSSRFNCRRCFSPHLSAGDVSRDT